LYPLLLIPVAVIGASNMVNLLGGYNGLEAGIGVITLLNLTVYSYVHGSDVAALIGAITCAAVLAFLFYNWVPAKIFPGDSLTYLLGGVIAFMAILGNIETAALLVSLPFFFEFALKLRGRLKKQSYGMYSNGKVKSLYDKVYSLPHFFTLQGRFTEKQVVLFVYLIQVLFSALIWLI
ncbi:glycosyl transferase family 4, partial [Candidatus Woesearchaeota archaeon]|nr:glycosyl transferase family 4 [Candidatus Woesearchaeota archaeon]